MLPTSIYGHQQIGISVDSVGNRETTGLSETQPTRRVGSRIDDLLVTVLMSCSGNFGLGWDIAMSFHKQVWYFNFNVGCIPTRPVTGCIQDWMHPRLIDFSRRDNSLAGVRHGCQSKVNAFLIIITTLDMLIQHCQMLICRWWLHLADYITLHLADYIALHLAEIIITSKVFSDDFSANNIKYCQRHNGPRVLIP